APYITSVRRRPLLSKVKTLMPYARGTSVELCPKWLPFLKTRHVEKRLDYEQTLRHVTFCRHDTRPLHHSDIVGEGHLGNYVFMHCLCVCTNIYVYVEGKPFSNSRNSNKLINPAMVYIL
ncbi:hypothetical protein STEG23_016994, partial [Scotinomys teguina]